MARTKGPLFSVEASGKFANALAYIKLNRSPSVGRYHKPSSYKSEQQLIRREIYAEACHMWHTLSPNEQDSWKPTNLSKSVTAFNNFVSNYLLQIYKSQPITKSLPNIPFTGTFFDIYLQTPYYAAGALIPIGNYIYIIGKGETSGLLKLSKYNFSRKYFFLKNIFISLDPKPAYHNNYFYFNDYTLPYNLYFYNIQTHTYTGPHPNIFGLLYCTCHVTDGTTLFTSVRGWPMRILTTLIANPSTQTSTNLPINTDTLSFLELDSTHLYVNGGTTYLQIRRVLKNNISSGTTYNHATIPSNMACSLLDIPYLYLCPYGSSARIHRFPLSNPSTVQTLTVSALSSYVSAIISNNTHIYCAISTTPCRIYKIDKLSFSIIGYYTLPFSTSAIKFLHLDGSFLYMADASIRPLTFKMFL